MELTLQILQETLQEIQKKEDFINQFASLNSRNMRLFHMNRLVFEINNRIYRVMSYNEGENRILTEKFFESLGYNIFLPEIKEEQLSSSIFYVTSQEKIKVKEKQKVKLPREVEELFKTYGFIWYEDKNCGEKDGKIYIFDWAANLSVSTKGLIDRKGNILYGY